MTFFCIPFRCIVTVYWASCKANETMYFKLILGSQLSGFVKKVDVSRYRYWMFLKQGRVDLQCICRTLSGYCVAEPWNFRVPIWLIQNRNTNREAQIRLKLLWKWRWFVIAVNQDNKISSLRPGTGTINIEHRPTCYYTTGPIGA